MLPLEAEYSKGDPYLQRTEPTIFFDSLAVMTTTTEGSSSLRHFFGDAHASLEDIFSADRNGVMSVRRLNALTFSPS